MPKLPKSPLFFKVFIPLLDAGLDWHQCGVLCYVERLTNKNLPCFASVETISQELRIPARTIRRVIESLIEANYLLAIKHGRKRILQLSPAYFAVLEGVQIGHNQNLNSGQNGHDDSGQNGHLPRSNIPRSKDLDLNINKLTLGLSNTRDLDLGSLSPFEKQKLELLNMGVKWDDIPE
jgi:hypothetical protein